MLIDAAYINAVLTSLLDLSSVLFLTSVDIAFFWKVRNALHASTFAPGQVAIGATYVRA